MRNLSAANLKQRRSPKDWIPPVEGSLTRMLWDVLQAHKCIPFDVTGFFKGRRLTNRSAVRIALTDVWGLDIAYRKTVWTLVGEWKGKDYHDYRTPRYHKRILDAIDATRPDADGVQQNEPASDPAEVPFWGS